MTESALKETKKNEYLDEEMNGVTDYEANEDRKTLEESITNLKLTHQRKY